MDKAYFIQLADYNIWANNIMHSWMDQIDDIQWHMTIMNSFNSIQQTALHVLSAERVWLDRLHEVASPAWLPSTFNGTTKEIQQLWKEASSQHKLFVEHFEESRLHEKLAFKRINGESVVMEYYQIFAHVFNHSTYHRGQLVTMLRQAGFTDVTSTDLLGYYRNS